MKYGVVLDVHSMIFFVNIFPQKSPGFYMSAVQVFENTGKNRNCSLRVISCFPTVFSTW